MIVQPEGQAFLAQPLVDLLQYGFRSVARNDGAPSSFAKRTASSMSLASLIVAA